MTPAWRYPRSDSAPRPMRIRLLILLLIVLTGCAHHIEVNPRPAGPTSTSIPRSLQLAVGPLSMEGADHRPGIALLEWPHRDLSQALIRYIQQRGTFSSVSTNTADLTLRITTKLALTSRGRYHYRVRLQAELSETAQLIKSYLVEHTAVGSSVRWVTTSDRDPIEAALQLALDDLFAQIEEDHSLYLSGKKHLAK